MKGLLISLFLILSSCTLSFQNISTHGVANDLVDENLTTSPDIKSNIELPKLPI